MQSVIINIIIPSTEVETQGSIVFTPLGVPKIGTVTILYTAEFKLLVVLLLL
jgi:hypothetical protein